MNPPARRKLLFPLAIAVSLGILLLLAPARQALLQAAGHWLVRDDPLEAADAVVIAVDAKAAGVLEAVELVHAGLAARVAVFADAATRSDAELARRGLPGFDDASISIRELRDLGVDAAQRIDLPVEGTEDEGATLAAWCQRQGLRTVLFVSNADHSRRTHRVMARAMAAGGARILVRASRFSEFDPDAWWHTRRGVRTQIVELEKLLVDLLRHPFG
jgi:uncharacterized SAM-binding protein YcdF (DUF218 family)